MLAWLGFGLLGLAALAGVLLSTAFVLVSIGKGRELLVPRLLGLANDAIAGRIELDAFRILPGGRLELEGVRVVDPDGDEVSSIGRATLLLDLSRLRSQTIGAEIEIDHLAVLIEKEEDGGISIVRAFAPKHPSAGPEVESTGGTSWSVKLLKLSVRDGELRYVEGGKAAVHARSLVLDARGEGDSRKAEGEVRMRAELVEPLAAAATVDLAFSLRESRFQIPLLMAALGGTALDLVAEGDLSRREGRLAVETLKVSARDVKALSPRAPLAGDLVASLFAASDGSKATASLRVQPAASGDAAVAARATAAVWVTSDAAAAGFDLALRKLDPSRLATVAPPGEITISARGRAAGSKLEDLRGMLSLSLAPSRLRGGRFGPAELVATAREGELELVRLEASLPGATIRGSGRYALRGSLRGELSFDGHDLALLGKNLEAALAMALPPMAGSAQARAELAGTGAAPTVHVALTAPSLRVGPGEIGSLDLSADLRGPARDLEARFDAKAALLSVAGHVARDLSFTGGLEAGDGRVAFRTRIPELGEDPITFTAAGRLEEKRSRLLLTELTLAYPGSQFALTGPSRVTFSGPRVDRLELASGDARIALAGGMAAGKLDARLEVTRFDLSRIPRGVLPETLNVAGRVSLAAQASGPVGRPLVSGHVDLADGTLLTLKGLTAAADVRFDGAARRAGLTLQVKRAEGGILEGKADLPVDPSRSRSDARLSANLGVSGFPVSELLRLAELDAPLTGTAVATIDLGGTLGAPKVDATIGLTGARYGNWDGLAVNVVLRNSEKEARLEGALDTAGGRAVDLELAVPLALAELLRDPTRAVHSLERAPLQVKVTVPGLDLAAFAGKGSIPLAGKVAGTLAARGSLAAPRADLALKGSALAVAGRPLGELTVTGQYVPNSGTISADLLAASGGTIRLSAKAQAALGLGTALPDFRRVPAEVHVTADELDLGFLPAAAPGMVRSASGKLNAKLDATGPIAELWPKGTLTLSGGELAIAELGEWTGIAIMASASEDELRLDQFTARRGKGRLTAHAQAVGLARKDVPADLSGEVKLDKLTITRAGQDLATIDLDLGLKGVYAGRELKADVTIPAAVVKLPNKTPRSLQTLDGRTDISVGVATQKKGPSSRASDEPSLHALVRVLVPNRFFIKGDDPRIDIELKADVAMEKKGDQVFATGYVQTIRGMVEPVTDRTFEIERGRVVFMGGEVTSGTLDVAATYENPSAKVHVLVSGPMMSPQIKLTSEPPLDESQIAMLIATGRTELKAGSGGIGTLTGEEAGRAALGALSTKLFKSFNSALADKLPLDVVSVDSAQLRAGKYVTDKLYVGYTRRFNAQPELGENPNEVRVEYQISPRWTFESRYGDANSGGASLIWSKDY